MLVLRILLVMLGVVTFGYGIRCFHKDHYKSAITCLILATIFLLTDPSSFQGFLKTGIIARLNAFGRRIDGIQDALVTQQSELEASQNDLRVQQTELSNTQARVENHQGQLNEQQEKIAKQQKDLEQQQLILETNQVELATTQETIRKQQERLANVETLVTDIYSRTRIETFRAIDTNAICFIEKTDGGLVAVMKLSHCPIRESIQGMYGNTPLRPTSYKLLDNVLATVWKAGSSFTDDVYTVTYVIDPRNTNHCSRLEVRNSNVFLDGQEVSREWIP